MPAPRIWHGDRPGGPKSPTWQVRAAALAISDGASGPQDLQKGILAIYRPFQAFPRAPAIAGAEEKESRVW